VPDEGFSPLALTFRQFAELECRGSSRLYEFLANRIAGDDELLTLASHAPSGQPVPNLFFAAVHSLLLSGSHHPLRRFYPSLVAQPEDRHRSFPAFKAFCAAHDKAIRQLLQTRRVQTNDVRRCAYLYPAFCGIHQRVRQPLALVEIGTAAGLNLIWNRYAYDYGGGQVYGTAGSPVRIRSTVKGPVRPPLEAEPPPVAYRVGVDVEIVDLTAKDQRLWLRALIWPEHKERLELMTRAADVLTADPPRLDQGDALELLEGFSREAPEEAMLCVYHTHVANQFSPEEKARLVQIVDRIAERRGICHLYNNMGDGLLHLDVLGADQPSREVIARTDGHARWFEWMPRDR
jgi:hypothetical protein